MQLSNSQGCAALSEVFLKSHCSRKRRDMADIVFPERSETLHTVKPAGSLNNEFAGITFPQNPGLEENNWSSAHQDSYCSESVGLKGPKSNRLRVIKKLNPYGFTPIMGCNKHNQMVGMSFQGGIFQLIVFDTDCNILTADVTGRNIDIALTGSFAGGYFFLNQDGNAIVVGDNKLKAFPTGQCVAKKEEVYELKPIWTSDNIVRAITGGDENTLYAAMPVWGQKDLYWCLLAGQVKISDRHDVTITNSAYIAVVEVLPRSSKAGVDVITTVLAKKELNTPYKQYNNNTFAATEEGAVFITNGLDEFGKATSGYCYLASFVKGVLTVQWQSDYSNSGFLKVGQNNVGSGTTPTIMVDKSTGRKMVAITDNAYPQMNAVVYDYETGAKISETPVFSKMRGCNEASVIGVNDTMFVPNNFGHTVDLTRSQYVSNEPGLAKLKVDATPKKSEVVWDQEHYTFFGMSMLARESGVIFAHSGDWSDEASATEGPVYYILAIDSWDGRVIWRVPIGRGRPYCHEYGGIYFDRTGEKIFMGTNRFLIAIHDRPQTEK